MEQVKKLLKDSAAIRFSVLGMISVLMFGTYWFQDGLGPLKGLFESQLGFTSTQFGLLISSTTWANLAFDSAVSLPFLSDLTLPAGECQPRLSQPLPSSDWAHLCSWLISCLT